MVEAAATLLEREVEFAALTSALAEAREGRGQMMLIEASAGLGKTSLLRAACATAATGDFTCLRARASELEHDFAYGCVRQLLEPAVARLSEREREQLFEGAAVRSAPLFAPAEVSEPFSSIDKAFSILHGLYWLLDNLAATGPVVLAIDDLHWADPESLRLLNYLTPRLDGLHLAVLASCRTGENVSSDLARLSASPETHVLRPDPLSVEATGILCERRLGATPAREFAAACREATGGNPFFLEELLREASEEGLVPGVAESVRVRGIGPTSVAQSVLLRLSAAPVAASALVRALAVLGDGARVPEAARLAELPEDEAGRAADLLVTMAILQSGNTLEFAHPIVREAVATDIGARARAQAHARAAALLAASGASDERVAAQIEQAEPAGDPGRVVLLRRVGAAALGRGAPGAAARWLDRALAEPPPLDTAGAVLLELGSAELRVAAPEAIDHLVAAVELIGEPAPLATAARLLANAYTMVGDADRAVEVLERTIAIVETADRERGLLLEAEVAAHAQHASREARSAAVARIERYRSLDGSTPAERLLLASLAFADAKASGSAQEAADHIERALAAGRLLAEQDVDIVGTFYLLMVGLAATDALDLAIASWDQALADADVRGSTPATGYVLAHRGRVFLRQGAVVRAEADARTALELLTEHEVPLGSHVSLATLIGALIEAGEIDAAEHALETHGPGTAIPAGMPHNPLLEARGMLRLAQGRMEDAVRDLVEFGGRDELWGGGNPLASRWRSHASIALAALGDDARAHRMAADDLAQARRWGAASGVGVALRATAFVDGGERMLDRLQEAVDVLAGSPARLEHARALTDLGAALRRANRRSDARAVLREGLDRARRCSARALVERARTELRAAGGRSTGLAVTGADALTASERRVAELAAEGLTNPEIAQTLFVTRKTVETHLGHVYRKLGITGRGRLARALADSA